MAGLAWPADVPGQVPDARASMPAAAPWQADPRLLAIRYTPAAEGLPLSSSVGPSSSGHSLAFEHFWGGKRTALAIGIEPYAMLVHKAKARAARIGSFTLAGLAEQGVRPRLPINLNPDSGSFGDSGWIHPLFAHFTGWPARGAPVLSDLFLDAAALDGMNRLRETLLERCDPVPVDSGDEVLAALLDPARPHTLAVYGNPLTLAARLRSLGRSAAEFEAVSLQQFMGLSSPSLFRTAALQTKSGDDTARAVERMRQLSEATACGQAPPLPLTVQHQAAPAGAPVLAALPHDFAFYARLPQLNCIADTPLMATLALNLLRPRTGGRAASDGAGCVYAAAAAAHYEIVKHAHRERGARPVARSAVPAFNAV